MKNLFVLLIAFGYMSGAKAADSGINTSSLKVKVYAMYASKSELCTDLVEFFSTASPEYKNVLENPSFASIDNAAGTYDGTWKCIVIKMEDLIKYIPAASSDTGNCVANTEYELDVFGASDTSTDNAGNEITGTASSGDIAYLYLSTASTLTTGAEGSNAWKAPTASVTTNGFTLANAWVISGAKGGKFVVNGDGKVEDSSGSCDMQPPAFSFAENS